MNTYLILVQDSSELLTVIFAQKFNAENMIVALQNVREHYRHLSDDEFEILQITLISQQ